MADHPEILHPVKRDRPANNPEESMPEEKSTDQERHGNSP